MHDVLFSSVLSKFNDNLFHFNHVITIVLIDFNFLLLT